MQVYTHVFEEQRTGAALAFAELIGKVG
jgi:hypothetical protein